MKWSPVLTVDISLPSSWRMRGEVPGRLALGVTSPDQGNLPESCGPYMSHCDTAVDSYVALLWTLVWHCCVYCVALLWTLVWHCCVSCVALLCTLVWHCCELFYGIAVDSGVALLWVPVWNCCGLLYGTDVDSSNALLWTTLWPWCGLQYGTAVDSYVALLWIPAWHCCGLLCGIAAYSYMALLRPPGGIAVDTCVALLSRLPHSGMKEFILEE